MVHSPGGLSPVRSTHDGLLWPPLPIPRFVLQAWTPRLPRDLSMRKILSFMFCLSLTAMWLIACGSSDKKVLPPQGQTSTFAFMQEAPTLFTPMLGTFTTIGSNTTFSSKAVIDTSKNQPLEADFESVILSANGKKATLELWGGMEADSDVTQIVVANVDGTGAVQITNDNYWNEMPQFSPDGTKVIFNSDRLAPDNSWYEQIVVRNADGTGSETVLPFPSGVDGYWAPTYSPDGSKIAVEAWGQNSETDAYFDGIWVMDAEGNNMTMLTNPQATLTCDACFSYDEHPSFSADGSKIIFSRDTYSWSPDYVESEDIFIMNADGSGVTQLTSGAGINFDTLALNVAGVGERILFSSNRANPSSRGSFDLYSMKLDGTGVTQVTNNSLYDSFSVFWYGSGASATSAARHGRHSGVSSQQRHPQVHVRGDMVHF